MPGGWKVYKPGCRKGIQIGAHDLIIGSTALSLGFSVATYNLRYFERIDRLNVETLNFDEKPSIESE